MEVLKFDLNQQGKPFKVLNATNGGPWHWRHTLGQYRSNLEAYKKLRSESPMKSTRPYAGIPPVSRI